METTTTPIRVMLVDDHNTMLWGLQRLLETPECNMQVVASATTVETARQELARCNPDVVLLDRAIRAGARGLLRKDAPAEHVIKAIGKVSEGELWIDHAMMARVLQELTRPAPPRKADPEAARLATLTAREQKIIASVVAGNGALNRSLAQSLFISEHTLRNHLVSIYKKLGVANRLELYVYAVKHHLGAEENAS